jgi:hypothetical protein
MRFEIVNIQGNHQLENRLMHRTLSRWACAAALALLGHGSLAHAAPLAANTTADGVAYFTYDRGAWATNAPYADYYDIHAVPTGASGPTADADGQRWIFPQRFEGPTFVNAAYPADYLIPLAESFPLAEPVGGFAMPVNTYVTNSFATGHKVTSYDSTTNPGGYIGLGGSFRVTSDFNEPGASVWWVHLALQQDQTDMIWRLVATSGAGQGSIFELTNVTTETVNGRLHLSADYIWGNTDWLNFLQDANGHLDTQAILGHIELTPVPEPGTLAMAAAGFVGLAFNCVRRRRARTRQQS